MSRIVTLYGWFSESKNNSIFTFIHGTCPFNSDFLGELMVEILGDLGREHGLLGRIFTTFSRKIISDLSGLSDLSGVNLEVSDKFFWLPIR